MGTNQDIGSYSLEYNLADSGESSVIIIDQYSTAGTITAEVYVQDINAFVEVVIDGVSIIYNTEEATGEWYDYKINVEAYIQSEKEFILKLVNATRSSINFHEFDMSKKGISPIINERFNGSFDHLWFPNSFGAAFSSFDIVEESAGDFSTNNGALTLPLYGASVLYTPPRVYMDFRTTFDNKINIKTNRNLYIKYNGTLDGCLFLFTADNSKIPIVVETNKIYSLYDACIYAINNNPSFDGECISIGFYYELELN